MFRFRFLTIIFSFVLLFPINFAFIIANAAKVTAQSDRSEELVVRTATNLVTIHATVKDSEGHIIGGLNASNFNIYDNGVEQCIEQFSQQDWPVTVGIILDTSISMKDRLDHCRDGIREFLKSRVQGDQFFLLSFNTRVDIERDLTFSPDNILAPLFGLKAAGLTALNDAIYLGLAKAERGRYHKRALVVLTDGDDNNSKYKQPELLYAITESDVQVYVIGLAMDKQAFSKSGQKLLYAITETSGGLAFFPKTAVELEDAISAISVDLRSQYAISFSPSANPSGNWHTLKIKARQAATIPLAVRARRGYYY